MIADADVATQTKHSFLLPSAIHILCLKVKVTKLVRLTHADVDSVSAVHFALHSLCTHSKGFFFNQ